MALERYNRFIFGDRNAKESYLPSGRYFDYLVNIFNTTYNSTIDNINTIEGDIDLIEEDVINIKNTLSTENISKEYEVDRVLTDEEVTTMFTTPIELVEAPGEGKFIQITTDPVLITTYGNAAMTGGGNIFISNDSTIITTVCSASNSLASETNKIIFISLLNTANGIVLSENTSITVSNATEVFVQGDSTSTIRIRFKYRIHTL